MKRARLWRGVRAFNWVAGACGLAWVGLVGVGQMQEGWREHWREERTLNCLAFSPDGKTLVGAGYRCGTGGEWGEVQAWDVATGQRRWHEKLHGGYSARSTLLPNRKTLVTIMRARIGPAALRSDAYIEPSQYVLIFRDIQTGTVIAVSKATPELVPDDPIDMDVAPDGHAVAVVFPDRVVIWNVEERVRKGESEWHTPLLAEPRTLPGPEKRSLRRAYFSADGQQLVVFSILSLATDFLALL